MAAELNSTNHSEIHRANIAMYNGVSVQGDKGTAKGSKVEDSIESSTEGEDPLAELLRDYEKAKAKMESNLSPSSINDLKNSPIGQALANDPIWEAATSPTPTKTHLDPNAIKNFFFLIFKFLKEHKDSDSKVQVAQAVNLLAKGKILDQVTAGAVSSLNDMKAQIQKAKDEENSPLNKFLKIGLPIILAVVSVVIIIATFGTATPAVAAADAATTAGVEAGAAAGTDAAVTAGTEASAETAASTLSTGAGSVIDNASTGATELTEMGTQTTTAETEASISETSFTTAEGSTSTTTTTQATQSATQAATRTAAQTTQRTLGQTIAQTAAKFWAVVKNPMLVTGVLVPVNVTVNQQTSSKIDNDFSNAMNEAAAGEQGEMAINTASSDGLQNDIKADMNYEQNAQQEEEADASMEQQTIQASTKIYSLGNF